MNAVMFRCAGATLALALAAGLTACNRNNPEATTPPPAQTDGTGGAMPRTPSPSGEASPHPGTGPANGSTAIGGMSGGSGSGQGGQSDSTMPHATGGDGQAGTGTGSAASAPQGTRQTP